jgi:cyclophilin family peptidyl-prolyl cis-trans isomerase
MKYFIACLIILLTTNVHSQEGPIITMQTNFGTIVLEMNPEQAPKTVDNFLRYVKDDFYNGTIFHRVIRGFVIQGGGYTQDYEKKPTRPSIPNESENGLENHRGTIAMARTTYNADSATSQFFINVNNNTSLNYQASSLDSDRGYTVFGQVIKGMDVVDKIQKVRTNAAGPFRRYVPKTPVIIESVKVENTLVKSLPEEILSDDGGIETESRESSETATGTNETLSELNEAETEETEDDDIEDDDIEDDDIEDDDIEDDEIEDDEIEDDEIEDDETDETEYSETEIESEEVDSEKTDSRDDDNLVTAEQETIADNSNSYSVSVNESQEDIASLKTSEVSEIETDSTTESNLSITKDLGSVAKKETPRFHSDQETIPLGENTLTDKSARLDSLTQSEEQRKLENTQTLQMSGSYPFMTSFSAPDLPSRADQPEPLSN